MSSTLRARQLLAVLQPIWTAKAQTASRLRGRILKILDAAEVKGHRAGENPVLWRGHLDHLLPKRLTLQRGHDPALPWPALPKFIVACGPWTALPGGLSNSRS